MRIPTLKRLSFLCAFILILLSFNSCNTQRKIGVLFVVHGGFADYNPQNLFDVSIQMFSYNPNHPVHKLFLWNSQQWGSILNAGNAPKEIGKYAYEYERLGWSDPFHDITDRQLAAMDSLLQESADENTSFVTDYACWMCSGDGLLDHYPYPRYIYNVPDHIEPSGFLPEEAISNVTYCGEDEADGPWEGCDPDRFDVDGPVERFIDQGVTEIIIVDLTTGGVRFFKTYDVVQMVKKVLADRRSTIKVTWANDPTELMERSYPTSPEGWTETQGEPEEDPSVPLAQSPNPVIEDRDLALLIVEGIETSFSQAVDPAETGIVLLNHATREWNQLFDPKIDDTLTINKNIKALLLERYPDMDADNIVGAYMGVKETGPSGVFERTREMRGENLGYAYLYEIVPATLPGDEWGYRYWDALALLKERGVEHIVIGFPQIVTDSVLNLVEIHNQMAKELGTKNWLYHGIPDYETYPDVGHPFADYWGIWVDTDCSYSTGLAGSAVNTDCCFEMGGCEDGRPYPPLRQVADNASRDDLDPSLAYDISEYGHLGYDSALGSPDPNAPVQDQYTGTWAMYRPPNDDPRLADILVKHVLDIAFDSSD